MNHRVLIVLALLGMPGIGLAQPERYELGQRLKRFEEAWNQIQENGPRSQALKDLPQLTSLFFSFQFGEAGRLLDRGTDLLNSRVSTNTEQYLRSLYAMPSARLIDAAEPKLNLTVKPFYPVKEAAMPGVTFSLRWAGEDNPSSTTEGIKQWPFKPAIPFSTKKGDVMPMDWAVEDVATITLSTGEFTETSQVQVSRVRNLSSRLEALKKVKNLPAIEAATLIDRYDLLSEMAKGFIPETDIPAAKLIREAEQIQQLGKKAYFTAERAGQFWLSFPTGKSRRTAARLFVPERLEAGKTVPIVVALHGAGGSENLFFEGYGAGQIVKECQQRGWLLLATRSGLGFGAAPPLDTILDQLASRYPLDRQRVFLVGHSMGAGQAIAAVQAYPKLFRGVAALGGGGAVRQKEPFQTLPVFVGVGEQDFALRQSRGLAKALTDGGAKRVELKVYSRIEHMVIVREALPDVFANWDQLAK